MRNPLEHELRDALARNLDLIEPGLRLVRCEFPLANASGTRGSIDILARDRNLMWVVIELKRDKAASRQAVQEVAKYIELLRREKHIAADRIRAVIVSTVWDELLVPVSNIAREWSYDLRGYKLIVAEDGTICDAQQVELLAGSFERRVSPIHVIYLFATAEERHQGWTEIVKRASEVGAVDLLAADFDRARRPDRVVASFGLYLAMGRIDPSRASSEILQTYDGPEPFACDYPAEYLALCHVTRLVRATDIESAVPGELTKISQDQNWNITGYRGAGAFADTTARDDLDLFRFLGGSDRGDSQIKFTSSANPRMRTRWKAFMEETEGSLGGNDDWGILVRAWLKRVAAYPGDSDIGLHIYNPCDLVQTIVFGWPDRVNDYEPMVLGFAERPQADDCCMIRGSLCWDGKPRADIRRQVHSIYKDPVSWMTARYGGITWIHDQNLIECLGLRYVLLEIAGSDPSHPKATDERALWIVQNGAFKRTSSSDRHEFEAALAEISCGGQPVGLQTFLSQHKHQVDALVTEYRRYLHIVDPG